MAQLRDFGKTGHIVPINGRYLSFVVGGFQEMDGEDIADGLRVKCEISTFLDK